MMLRRRERECEANFETIMVVTLYRALPREGIRRADSLDLVLPSRLLMPPEFDPKVWLAQLSTEMRDGFARTRRVISYGE